jgi:lipopolysaccharide export system permease protein
MLVFKQDTMDFSTTPPSSQHLRDSAEMSLSELLSPDPSAVSARDMGKFKVEGWRRLTSPLTCFSFAMIGMFTMLRGAFSRHGTITRPLVAVLCIVGLLAGAMLLQNLAGRDIRLIPLIPLFATLPGLICAYLLFVPEIKANRRQPRPA